MNSAAENTVRIGQPKRYELEIRLTDGKLIKINRLMKVDLLINAKPTDAKCQI